MYEEMLLDKEHDQITKHDKIYIVQPDSFNQAQLRREIKKLERLATLMDNDRIIEKLEKMVPDYKR
jgi:FlaA1/EpsC-like NDP-sugar epimerase